VSGTGRYMQVSPISPDERGAISSFVRSASWQYTHFDYPRREVLSRPGYQATNRAGKRVGVLGCGKDDLPIARLLFAAVDQRERPREVIASLLEPNERELRDGGAAELVFVGWAPWLARCLRAAGFALRTTVLTYQRLGDALPETGNQDVHLRPAVDADVDVLVDLDQAAFAPMWRYSAGIHRRLIGSAAYCTIAEHDGTPIGYQTSDISADHGYIIRLAVHPDWQGQGVGTRLLVAAIQFFHPGRVQRVMVNTQADNAISRRLYERFGFVRRAEEAPALVKQIAPAVEESNPRSSGVIA